MACNVYLTFFHKYSATQLRQIEWKYVLFCYGLPFVPAITYVFIRTNARGPIYGPADVSFSLMSKKMKEETNCLNSCGAGSHSPGIFCVLLPSTARYGLLFSSRSGFIYVLEKRYIGIEINFKISAV